MNSYLLLRSNKESGPFSLEELISNGLKPYDLVWVKGRSAAWRYPSEVDELKPYAPQVEEQPFDRFYKKPVEQAKKVEPRPAVIETKPQIKEEFKEEELSPYQPQAAKAEQKAYIPKKSVFVTLPGQKTVAVDRPVKKEVKPLAETSQPVLVEDTTPKPTISITENPAAQVKYSQPLDEIKEMYVKTLHERKTRIAKKGYMKVYLQRAALIAGLVGIGVLAGFIIKPKGGKPNADNGQIAQAVPPITNPIILEDTIVDNPPANQITTGDRTTIPPTVEERPAISEQLKPENVKLKKSQPEIGDDIENLNKTSALNARKNSLTESNPTERVQELHQYNGTDIDPVTGERTKAVRNENNNSATVYEKAAVPKAIKSALDGQVVVSSNDYKRVAFGGIRNLRLTVTNNSKFELENVVVELLYLKPSEQALRTENVEFRTIAPNESATIRIPDTNRGIKVDYRIVSIGKKTDLSLR